MRTRRICAASAAVIAIAGLAAGGTTIAGATTARTVAAVTGALWPQLISAPSNGLTSAAPSTAPLVSVDPPGTTAFTTGSAAETVVPEPLQMRGESALSIPEPTQPQAPITGSLQERAQAATAPKT